MRIEYAHSTKEIASLIAFLDGIPLVEVYKAVIWLLADMFLYLYALKLQMRCWQSGSSFAVQARRACPTT